jgi:soluble epoxide hydrolase/lipid-phosphate phosphatase
VAAAKLPSTLRLPVLFLWGPMDPVTTPMQMQRARKWIPRLQDIGFEGKGHWLMVEAKEMVTEKVMGWLDGLLINPTSKVKL